MAYASVGMMYPVFAPFQSHTDGSMPTYGAGRVIQEARNANVSKTYANNPLYGDDRIVDDDNSLVDLAMSFESTGLDNEDRQKLLGEELNANTATGGQWVSDSATPYGGFGYIEKMRDKGVKAEFRVRDGVHNWEYWNQSLRWSLPFASQYFGE